MQPSRNEYLRTYLVEFNSNDRETLAEQINSTLIDQNPILKKGPTLDDFSKAEISKDAQQELIQMITEAIDNKYYVRIIYRNRNEKIETRSLSKLEIKLDNNKTKTFVKGYCHLRKDFRTFRIERIQSLEILNLTYELPIL